MSRKSFEEFINAQPEEPAADAFNVAKELDEWLKALDKLYANVRSYLSPFKAQGKVAIEDGEVELHEEATGPYQAPKMSIRMGPHVVTLLPIGTFLIGAKGRVDMKGPRGTVRFVLVPKDSSAPRITVSIRRADDPATEPQQPPPVLEWDWKIATSPPHVRYQEINEDSFLDALLEIVNG
ncbi:hypothetical protein J2W28_002275 [Variovorax boronicumulans]|uniref:hypothetical protein n=1 Tax=Variovorax boronicumulans TaxID=436515 RepID=UPI002788EAFD|nr:hypothetical protein [Variovorax boronicumulans]MDP9991508.1 hypothetical protein [Variovorax boronicumulans]MDQ0003128.1 hypothetical protein [Variovorax boronicumulans]